MNIQKELIPTCLCLLQTIQKKVRFTQVGSQLTKNNIVDTNYSVILAVIMPQMHYNFFNLTILLASSLVIVLAIVKLFQFRKNNTAKYLYWFIITANLVVVQLMLMDTKFTHVYPAIAIFFLPYQYVSPVLFTAFTCSYLDKMVLFKKHNYVLLAPFLVFLVAYTFLKVNIILDYLWISKKAVAYFGAEIDENIAVSFSLLLGIYNYWIIKNYRKQLGNLPYQIVIKKTKWLLRAYGVLVVLSLIWVGIIAYMKIDSSVRGHAIYYPLWLMYLGFYYVFGFLGSKHLRKIVETKKLEKTQLKEIANSFQIQRLNKIFTSTELKSLQESQYDVTGILSYFASSLFDKHRVEDVLWDITANCISQLNLEDSVIYLVDSYKNILVQKAAYGNKHQGERKILSPIEIPFGKGIVGTVGKTCQPEMVNDLSKDKRYLEDDLQRSSELAVPIIFEGELLGVLDSEHSQKNFFEEKHLLFFQLIARLTATKLRQVYKKTSCGITNDNIYFKELTRLLEKEKIYQNPELSLASVANRLSISSTYLSQLVNKLTDYNFSDFINIYRVKDAELKLLCDDFNQYTIVGIGLESGFNSKSVFYTAFKKHTGKTPSDYKSKSLMMS